MLEGWHKALKLEYLKGKRLELCYLVDIIILYYIM